MEEPRTVRREKSRPPWLWGLLAGALLASCQSSQPIYRSRPVGGPGGGATVVARPLPGPAPAPVDVEGMSGYTILFNPGSVERQIDMKEERAERAREIQAQLEGQSAGFRDYVTELEAETQKRQQQIGELSGRVDQISQQIARITAEHTDLSSQFLRLDGRRKALRKELDFLADPSQSGVAGAARERRMEVLRGEVAKLEQEITGLEQEYTILNPGQ